MPKPSTESPVKDVEQAAAFLGVGEDLLYEMAARGEIPHCHVGRYLRFHQVDLEEYVRSSHHHQPLVPLRKGISPSKVVNANATGFPSQGTREAGRLTTH